MSSQQVSSRKTIIVFSLAVAGVLILLASTLLPWYGWNVDASELSDKLGEIDSSMVAKVAPGMKSAPEVLATYGGMSAGSLADRANLWSLLNASGLFYATAALLGVIVAASVSILVVELGGGWGEEKRPRGSRTLLAPATSLLVLLALVAYWPLMDRADSLWMQRNPAPNVKAAAWRQEAVGQGYFTIDGGRSYGFWVAAAGTGLLLAVAGIQVFGRRRAEETATTTE